MNFVNLTRNLVVIFMMMPFFTLASTSASAQSKDIGRLFRDCPDCPEMVVIPAGEFSMGSDIEEIQNEIANIPSNTGIAALLPGSDKRIAASYMQFERPRHKVVIIQDYMLGRYPVTRAQFAMFVNDTGHQTSPCRFAHTRRLSPSRESAWSHPYFDQSPTDPVVCISWQDAQAYITWLNEKIRPQKGTVSHDGPYRLPSEAEWEYAARAGTQTARWWGDAIGIDNTLCDGCNIHRCNDPQPRVLNGVVVWPCSIERLNVPIDHTLPVGRFNANPFGLYDMLGNAAQLTADCWHDGYVGAPTDGEPWLDGDCSRRLSRGGAWSSAPWTVRSATRSGASSDTADNSGGFRLARSITD